MAPHSSTRAWKIHGRRTEDDWATSLSLFSSMHWKRKWQPTPIFLPGESQGRQSLVGCCVWGCTESDTTEATQQQQQHHDHPWIYYPEKGFEASGLGHLHPDNCLLSGTVDVQQNSWFLLTTCHSNTTPNFDSQKCLQTLPDISQEAKSFPPASLPIQNHLDQTVTILLYLLYYTI